jgi:peptidoglycan DL-endopeptidase CwlO
LTPTSPVFRRHASLTVGALAAVALALGPANTVLAAPTPTEAELRTDLAESTTKVDKLIKAHAAKRKSLKKARKTAALAKKNLSKAEEVYAEVKQQVDAVVQGNYRSGEGNLPALLFAPDLRGATVAGQLTVQQSSYIQSFAAGLERMKKTAESAAELTGTIEAEVRKADTRRDKAEKVIGDIENRLNRLVPTGSGRRADGTWAPQSPTGADNITDRTRIMREAVAKRFDLPYSVGCHRSGGSGEHPLGRACDFMMSTGGAMPSAANLKLGDEIAAWAVKNKARLGVKYVIWRQRINMGSGWRAMSNRGGVTANHYDHPHISMY